jgi:hypothetical protein
MREGLSTYQQMGWKLSQPSVRLGSSSCLGAMSHNGRIVTWMLSSIAGHLYHPQVTSHMVHDEITFSAHGHFAATRRLLQALTNGGPSSVIVQGLYKGAVH